MTQKISDTTIAEAINNPNFSFIETFADASDSAKVTQEMTALLFKHRKKREQLQVRERERVVIEKKLNDSKRASYLKHKSAPNEKMKSILVEIDTEEEAYKLAIVEQQIKELTRDLSSIRTEIDTWKAISYNLRTEMGSF